MATMDLGRVRGNDGVGVPSGGTAGQVLAKASEKEHDTKWIDPPQGGSSVEIDATLKVPGKAADAKATGDALNRLSQQIENLEIPDPYTLPTASATVLGGVKVGSGSGLTIDANGMLSLALVDGDEVSY